jgi:hypothetical protein
LACETSSFTPGNDKQTKTSHGSGQYSFAVHRSKILFLD